MKNNDYGCCGVGSNPTVSTKEYIEKLKCYYYGY